MKSVSHMPDLMVPKKIEFPSNFLGPLLNGGFPEGSTLALVGPPGAGKTIFCESLANNFLQSDISCLCITTDRAPVDIRNDFRQLGTDVKKMESEKRLVFVDGYGWLAGNSNEIFGVENLANLTELIILTERASNYLNGRILLVLDSVSPLLVHNPEKDVIKFLQLLSARIRNWKGIGIYVVQAGVHSEEFYNALAYLVDGIFDMKIEEEKGTIRRYLRIRNLTFVAHKMTWAPFAIESGRNFKLQNLEADK